MPVPRSMTAHTLNPTKGWPSPHALDCRARLSANVTIDPVYAGRVVHLNSVGELEMGVPDVAASTGKAHMPLFLFPNSDDPDVQNPASNPASVAGGWVPVAPQYPSGPAMALVATGGYEFESTEYNSSQSYAPGDGLTATASNSDSATGGVLLKGNAYAKSLVGVVSRGVVTNGHGVSALAFWPVFLPRNT
jgi:hypothetical protein